MASTSQNIHGIIYAATAASAEVGEEASHVIEPDLVAITPIQTNMILAIASEYGVEISHAAAADLLHTLTETVRSRQVITGRQTLSGWLPGIEDDENGSTAAALTEAIGWAASSYFEKPEAK